MRRYWIKAAKSKWFHAISTNVFLSFLIILINISPVFAGKGLTVTGVLLMADVTPGETLNHRITVSTGDEAAATGITVTIEQVGQAMNGSYILGLDGNSKYSAVPFITIDKDSFSLGAGEIQELTATVCMPEDTGDGGRYAVIHIQTNTDGQGSVGISNAVNIPVYLTIAGSKIVHEGEISGISISEPSNGEPIDVLTVFKNTGNHHYKIRGEVIISDASGKTLDTIHLDITGNSIIPAMCRQLRATFVPEGNLSTGTYLVKSRVLTEEGTVLDESTSQFEIKTAYSPPPPPAEINITPSAAATLKTVDGRIVVTLPRGAVISEGRVCLRGYPLDQLPAPPAGFKLGTTSFRLEGVNGLLARQAFVEVKYSPSDLYIAHDEASRLVLGRWDEAQKRWSLLRTRLDKRTLTLSANTNQLGIWTIMVSESQPSSIPWLYLFKVAGVAIVCMTTIFVLSKNRRRG
jgi:hypothetical protein